MNKFLYELFARLARHYHRKHYGRYAGIIKQHFGHLP